MARRSTRGIEYAPAETSLPGLSVLIVKGEAAPELTKTHLKRLRRLPYQAWRLWTTRNLKKGLEAREDKLKTTINQTLDEMPAGIHGVRGRAGARSSMRLLRSTVQGREPVDPTAWLKFLGPHAETVIKTFDLPLHQVTADPARFKRLIAALVEIYGDEVASSLKLSIDSTKLNALQKAGELPDEPKQLWQTTPGHTRLTVEPVA